jgi:hypothetical protein
MNSLLQGRSKGVLSKLADIEVVGKNLPLVVNGEWAFFSLH